MADCYTSADSQRSKQRCHDTKGYTPKDIPLLVRAVSRLIAEDTIPTPRAIFVAVCAFPTALPSVLPLH